MTARRSVRDRLGAIPLFKGFHHDPQALGLIEESMQERQAAAGDPILKEGEPGNELWVLIKGSIEITKSTLAGESFTVAKLNDQMGVFFGEQALIDQDKRSATVTALSACEFLVLSREAFLELTKKSPSVGLALTLEIAGLLSKRLRKANEDSLLLFEALVNELRS
jgi:CRP-like cAMP-binding protein